MLAVVWIPIRFGAQYHTNHDFDLMKGRRTIIYYCYILLCADGTFYTGSTNDVAKRVATHNAGKGAKYTRNRRPVRLLYQQEFTSKSLALSFEAKFKRHRRQEKEAFLRDHQISWQSELGDGRN